MRKSKSTSSRQSKETEGRERPCHWAKKGDEYSPSTFQARTDDEGNPAFERRCREASDIHSRSVTSAQRNRGDEWFGDLMPERKVQEQRHDMERLPQMVNWRSRCSDPELSKRDL
ncbi:hypothetical protein HPB50_012985 [Hyalomma asiaticum]|uniref:Uncharacterized protein n=1 Tax=Hyalomma asiaticum TaxID=266040 RepID=A0ACB7RMH1_HYAAI|nr:hypothetical protein HPB50_012985 [Hyalomma asiaticum]